MPDDMEKRKQKEIEHYDKKAEEVLSEQVGGKDLGDFEGFKPQVLSSFKFAYNLLKENCRDKVVLDYGCGNGVHSFYFLKCGAKKVVGIDLSEKSLEIAIARAKKLGVENKMEFLKKDCENTEFPDNYFDLIFDGGTFSSLDLKNVFPELTRILKQNGMVVGIETFGHNPIANLKRKLNRVTGKRTEWAEGHIFNEEKLEEAGNYFGEIESWHFHVISFLAIPFLNILGGKIILKILETIDSALLSFSFLKKFGFKIVFVFKNPQK